MKIMPYEKIESKSFESDVVRGVKGRVGIGKADGAQHFCMRVFEVAPNGFTPLHSHEWEHEIFVHCGEGEVLRRGRWETISEGYVVFIPKNEEHQIRNKGAKPLVFACLIPSGVPEL